MNEKLFEFILASIPIIISIITYFIVPYFKTIVDTEKLKQYKEWATFAVKSAEMLFPDGGYGEDKKEYVVAFLNDMFNKNKVVITEEQIEILLEACVKEMKLQENT